MVIRRKKVKKVMVVHNLSQTNGILHLLLVSTPTARTSNTHTLQQSSCTVLFVVKGQQEKPKQ